MTTLLATAVLIGFLHALEVDHMLAVTTFVSRRPAVPLAARFGARWGIGHSLAVLGAGGLLLAFGVRWPVAWDAAGEALVGVMLAALGLWAIVSARRLHLHPAPEHGDHSHLHLHPGVSGHAHPHSAGSGAGHSHGAITAVGFLHGLAGTSAAVALVPVTFMDNAGAGLGYLAAFCVGVILAMTLFAAVAAAAMRRAERRSLLWSRRIATAVGIAAIGTGAFWMFSALG